MEDRSLSRSPSKARSNYTTPQKHPHIEIKNEIVKIQDEVIVEEKIVKIRSPDSLCLCMILLA